ncbi:MFS transporter [Methylobacterium pseudosasicola]|uniref:Predicted arabinose efflux permease, MFS family n=1 Tax=Methylobacterium pseudosasicola TaxID=582667 RepID=A0A1I4PRQ6_9HYPH|nr:MFS transporter [Methylobacterium pseudosasicola]SFM30457.1 Predicted arabinose efflux permease, MFS family [Methylobacterium pseudosasicola]
MTDNAIRASGVPDSSPLGFYGAMSLSERRTFWGCAAGWTLDGMDFMIYPLVLGTLVNLWHVDPSKAGLAATSTLLASAVGGWAAGYMCDRIGRVPTLQITIAWFSAFSLLCAFAQDFDQLLVARTLLGIGFGGEWAAGSILMAEMVRPEHRGRAVGTVQSGWAIGWGIAVLLQAVLFSLLPPEEAWRWMFAAGALPAILVFFLRRHVEEPALSRASRRRQAAAGDRPAITEIFRGSYLRTTLLASVMMAGAQGSYYAMSTWVPRYLTTERHLTLVGSTGYLATLILGSFAGYLTGAWLADVLGRRKLFVTFSAGAVITLLAYLQAPLPAGAIWALGFPLGFFSTGFFSGIGPFLSELYPTRLRGSGQGFCYNFGRGVGALFPTMVGALAAVTSLGNAITVFAGAAYVLFFSLSFAFPETRGMALDDHG